jgi:crotonobetainyl-CoA:carnitine CoA-transferase CaiB-like acyl-CoA transferase
MSRPGFLFDVKVLELADEKGEFCGKLLAGAGADVLKVEPPDGNATRALGPFYHDDPHPERSLYFWHYNFGKRGITLDIHTAEGTELLAKLIAQSDVLLDSLPLGTLETLGLDWAALQRLNPRLIYVVLTPFGRSGPWRDYKATDLIHLALGGQMMCCGYNPTADGTYDTPPIAPQMWHAYHIAGNQAFIATVGALIGRETSGRGEMIDVPIHQAVSVCTEIDVPYWIYNQTACYRQTGRHAQPVVGAEVQFPTKDGRYAIVLPNPFPGGYETLVDFLAEKGHAGDLKEEHYQDPSNRKGSAFARHFAEVQAECVAAFAMEEIWREAQARGIPWSPIRLPEENLQDEQWQMRATFTEVVHPELGQTLTYVGAPMLPHECAWREGPRAPLVGEHNEEVYGEQLGLSREDVARLKERRII